MITHKSAHCPMIHLYTNHRHNQIWAFLQSILVYFNRSGIFERILTLFSLPQTDLPTPPSFPEKDTSGFHAYTPADPAAAYSSSEEPTAGNDVKITPDQMMKAQKYCKWAGSALNYDDVKSAIENLQKGLRLLQTGRDE